jgi:hypothetical protein
LQRPQLTIVVSDAPSDCSTFIDMLPQASHINLNFGSSLILVNGSSADRAVECRGRKERPATTTLAPVIAHSLARRATAQIRARLARTGILLLDAWGGPSGCWSSML